VIQSKEKEDDDDDDETDQRFFFSFYSNCSISPFELIKDSSCRLRR